MNRTGQELVEVSGVKADLQAIAEVKVNPSKRLGVDLKKVLDKILDDAVRRRSVFVKEQKQRVEDSIIADQKKADGLDKLLDEYKSALAVAEQKAKKIVDKGYHLNGDLLSESYRGDWEAINSRVNISKTAADRAEKSRKFIKSAMESIEGELANVDKIRAKLFLCETYGEAQAILKAVMGNHDGIL